MKPGTSGVSQQHQDKRVTVTVFDALGPVIGASVVEKGTTNGGITDMEGKLTLEFQGTSRVIEVSYVGYEKQTIKVASSSVNIELKEDAQALDEVVVVGFGVQKKENLTGAISQVKMNEVLGDRPLANTTQALQGAVPGLFISGNHEPGGTDKKMQIRDAFSLGSGEVIRPLVLIDNVEGDLNMINPNDIDAISVLKDAASTAIYGARAAGGVIIITTKQPKKGEKFSLNYNNNIGFETAINLPQQASLDDYFKMYLEAGFSDSYWAGKQNVAKWKQYLQEYKANPGAFNIVNDGLYKGDDGNVYYLNEKDPYKAFMESSFVMNHNLSASGGTDKVRYRFSGGYTSQDGPLVTSADKYERLNVGAFMSADVTNWFTQVVDIKYSKGTKSMPSGGNLYTTRLISYNPNGTSGDIYGVPDKENLPFNTPLNSILYNNNKNTVTTNPRIFLKSIFKPIADLEAVFEYTFDKNDVLYDFYDAKTMFIDLQETPRWNVNQDSNEKKHYFTDYN
ncbi:SusC/RagA family TonB-linked outer membrane protein, partial [Parabacteroides goldsteinii]